MKVKRVSHATEPWEVELPPIAHRGPRIGLIVEGLTIEETVGLCVYPSNVQAQASSWNGKVCLLDRKHPRAGRNVLAEVCKILSVRRETVTIPGIWRSRVGRPDCLQRNRSEQEVCSLSPDQQGLVVGCSA